MNKHLLIAVTTSFILLAVVGLSGCDELTGSTTLTEENKLVGTWLTDDYYDTLTLYSNGKCMKFTHEGTWKLENGKLVLVYAIGKNTLRQIFDYSFSNENNTLTVTNIETDYTLVYTRK